MLLIGCPQMITTKTVAPKSQARSRRTEKGAGHIPRRKVPEEKARAAKEASSVRVSPWLIS